LLVSKTVRSLVAEYHRQQNILGIQIAQKRALKAPILSRQNMSFPCQTDRGLNLKLKLYVISFIFIVYSTAYAGDTIKLPAYSNIFFSEKDCIDVMKLRYSWTIDFAALLRQMEKSGKLIRYPQNVPINILETKTYKMHNYYRISIYNKLTQQYDVAWTDAVRFD